MSELLHWLDRRVTGQADALAIWLCQHDRPDLAMAIWKVFRLV